MKNRNPYKGASGYDARSPNYIQQLNKDYMRHMRQKPKFNSPNQGLLGPFSKSNNSLTNALTGKGDIKTLLQQLLQM